MKVRLTPSWSMLLRRSFMKWDATKYLSVIPSALALQVSILSYFIELLIEKTYTLLQNIELDKNILAAHFHNTYNRAIQNLVIALSVGLLLQVFN